MPNSDGFMLGVPGAGLARSGGHGRLGSSQISAADGYARRPGSGRGRARPVALPRPAAGSRTLIPEADCLAAGARATWEIGGRVTGYYSHRKDGRLTGMLVIALWRIIVPVLVRVVLVLVMLQIWLRFCVRRQQRGRAAGHQEKPSQTWRCKAGD